MGSSASVRSICAFVTVIAAGTTASASPGNFNGDAYGDIAIGVPSETVTGVGSAGAVQVFLGSQNGLVLDETGFITRATVDPSGSPQQGDQFGSAVATGDFDGDGFDDLAIGAPGMAISGETEAGAVFVIRGGAAGLKLNKAKRWSQNSNGIKDKAESNGKGDRFGASLAVGDFDGDGFDDLAIGVPSEDVKTVGGAGAVAVLYGTKHGLTATRNQFWHQDRRKVVGFCGDQNSFGASLAAADFDADGNDDLAIGAYNEVEGGVTQRGSVTILRGTKHGLKAKHSVALHASDFPGTDDNTHAYFGWSLAAGQFDSDGFADLAIGAPIERQGGVDDAGAVHVVYGAASGLSAGNTKQTWIDGSQGAGNIPQDNDRFGSTLASGDFDDDGVDDLAIGVPGQMLGMIANAGAVIVLYGTPLALAGLDNQYWSQDSSGISLASEANDRCGEGLGVGDFDGDGRADLAIGLPDEDIGSTVDAGAVLVLYGKDTNGLASAGAQTLYQDVSGVPDSSGVHDHFGAAISR